MSSASGHIARTIGIEGGALDLRLATAHFAVSLAVPHNAAASAIPVASCFFMSSTMASRQSRALGHMGLRLRPSDLTREVTVTGD